MNSSKQLQYAQMIISQRLQGNSSHYNYNQLQKSETFSVGLIDDNIFHWLIGFQGEQSTIFEGGFFQIECQFPNDFPNMPPKMKFRTEMWHPNIYPDGSICISILHKPGTDQYNPQELETEKWTPVMSLESVLVSIQNMLNFPNIESPANIDASNQFKNDLQAYNKKVRRLSQKTME